jgi:hypothetical protein
MAVCLIRRDRGLAVLVRSYLDITGPKIDWFHHDISRRNGGSAFKIALP